MVCTVNFFFFFFLTKHDWKEEERGWGMAGALTTCSMAALAHIICEETMCCKVIGASLMYWIYSDLNICHINICKILYFLLRCIESVLLLSEAHMANRERKENSHIDRKSQRTSPIPTALLSTFSLRTNRPPSSIALYLSLSRSEEWRRNLQWLDLDGTAAWTMACGDREPSALASMMVRGDRELRQSQVCIW